MKRLVIAFLTLLPIAGSAANAVDRLVDRVDALAALLAPGIERELKADLSRSPPAAPLTPPEDQNRELENRVWREENLGERYDQKLFRDPPRVPERSVVATNPAAAMKRELFLVTTGCHLLKITRATEIRPVRPGVVNPPARWRDNQVKNYRNLLGHLDTVAKHGGQFVTKAERAEFKRLAAEAREAYAALGLEIEETNAAAAAAKS